MGYTIVSDIYLVTSWVLVLIGVWLVGVTPINSGLLRHKASSTKGYAAAALAALGVTLFLRLANMTIKLFSGAALLFWDLLPFCF